MTELTFWQRMGMDPPPDDQADWNFWYCQKLCERINAYIARELTKDPSHD